MFDSIHFLMEIFNESSSTTRRNETIFCLIGFGIGVGCCLLYRLISNLFLSSPPKKVAPVQLRRSITLIPAITNEKTSVIKDDDHRRASEEMTWSEISSSLSTVHLLQDSYHSNSLAADSGVDCSERSKRSYHRSNDLIDDDDDDESLLRKYDSDTALHHDRQTATESHVMSYISTEKGLERALEQTTRFYTDLEHIASELGTLSKRYSQSQMSLNKYSHRSIDALDWDLQEEIHSPRSRKQHPYSSSLSRSNGKSKYRRRLNLSTNPVDYHESDHESRLLDSTTSPLRRRHSSVYFDSSDEDNAADETLQIK